MIVLWFIYRIFCWIKEEEMKVYSFFFRIVKILVVSFYFELRESVYKWFRIDLLKYIEVVLFLVKDLVWYIYFCLLCM